MKRCYLPVTKPHILRLPSLLFSLTKQKQFMPPAYVLSFPERRSWRWGHTSNFWHSALRIPVNRNPAIVIFLLLFAAQVSAQTYRARAPLPQVPQDGFYA